MIPAKVRFTGLEFDPDEVRDRWHRGIIPLHWAHHRFIISNDVRFPVNRLNRWLFNNIEGRWAVWTRVLGGHREVNMAFENDYDGVTFVLADGRNEAFKEH